MSALDGCQCGQQTDRRRRVLLPARTHLTMTQQLRILVAEDDPAIQKLLSHVLQRSSHEVTVVDDGAQALEQLGRSEYDVILLDLMMPRVSGADVLAHIGEHHPELLSRVIVVSAYTRLADSLIPSACSVVAKPFEIPQLMATIESCVRRSTSSDEPVS